MQKQEKKIFKGHRSTFCIKMPFGIGHPHLHIKCSLHVCGRVQGSQIFKRNSIILIPSKVMAFLVILLSLSSVIPTSSPCHPHSPQKVPMWSPWLWSPWSPWSPPHVVPVVPMLSPLSPYHPCHPHIMPTSTRRFPHHPQPPRYPLHPPVNPLGEWGAPNK